MAPFRAKIAILDINPYVLLPPSHLKALFDAANRDKGPIPVKGSIDGVDFRQTLVKYQGAWRLYLNTPMRKAAGKDVGDTVLVRVEFNARPRVERMPIKFKRALAQHREARVTYEALVPSRKKEILRYLNSLKTTISLERNIETVIRHLLGERPPKLRAMMRNQG